MEQRMNDNLGLGPVGALIVFVVGLGALWRWVASQLTRDQDKLKALEAEQSAQFKELRSENEALRGQVATLQAANAQLVASVATAEAHLEAGRADLKLAQLAIGELREENRLLRDNLEATRRLLTKRERQIFELGGIISEADE